MAHGNMLLGYARGSVGDVTFTRTNGNQVARARNRRPKNPRSNSQMAQRSLFASAVKMYQLAVANFFKFAFEDRKPHESDYNAFMRHNVKQGTNITQACFNDRKYPAIGDWLFAQGSLPAMNYYDSDNMVELNFDVTLPSFELPAPTTVGELSQYLVNDPKYMVGDMITLVDYGWYPYGTETFPSLVPPTGDHGTYFDFKQFIIDPNDSTPFQSLGYDLAILRNTGTQTGRIIMSSSDGVFDEQYRSFAAIHTRKKNDGSIMASNASIIMSGAYQQALNDSMDPVYIEQVLAAWRSSEDAILNPDSGGQAGSTQIYATPPSPFPITIAANGQSTMLNLFGVELKQGDTLRMMVKRDSNQPFYSNVIYQDGSTIDGAYFKLVDTDAESGGNKAITFMNTSSGSTKVTISSLQVNGRDVQILTF